MTKAAKALEQAVDRIEQRIADFRPEGEISTDNVSPEHLAYFNIREQVDRARYACRRATERVNAKSGGPSRRIAKPRRDQSNLRWTEETGLWDKIAAADDVPALLKDIVSSARPFGEDPSDSLTRALGEVSLLRLFAESAGPYDCRTIIHAQAVGVSRRREQELREYQQQARRRELKLTDSVSARIRELLTEVNRFQVAPATLVGLYRAVFERLTGAPLEYSDRAGENAVLIAGAAARFLAESERGLHLFFYPDGQMLPVRLIVAPVADRMTFAGALSRVKESKLEHLSESSRVVRVYSGESGPMADLRTGFVTPDSITIDELKQIVLSSLPPPSEVTGQSE